MQRLVVSEINAVLDRWAGCPEIYTYAMSYESSDCNHIKIWPTHNDCAHDFRNLIMMADSLEFDWYFTSVVNQDGVNTPCLVIFSV